MRIPSITAVIALLTSSSISFPFVDVRSPLIATALYIGSLVQLGQSNPFECFNAKLNQKKKNGLDQIMSHLQLKEGLYFLRTARITDAPGTYR